MVTIDYETEAIEGNPQVNPPRPVGVAIKLGNEPAKYFSWGHPSGNNCTEAEAQYVLRGIWASDEPLLFHNAAFDVAIAEKYHGFHMRDPLRIHDTQYLIFFTDPYAASLSLKPSAERILGVAPDEQDDLKSWILSNICRSTEKNFGAYIAQVPAWIVEKYAIGDVDRTKAIYDKLMPIVTDNGMFGAYQREQRLLPICMESSRNGIRVDREALCRDAEAAQRQLIECDNWFFQRLGREFDFDKDAQLAAALYDAGVVTEFIKTPTGKNSVSRKNLVKVIEDKDLLMRLNYRGALSTLISTFFLPWRELSQWDGRLHTEWNQVRTARDGSDKDSAGARTGRLSSMRPNFMNVPTEQPYEVQGWMPLPFMRQYLLPEEGHVWLKRDFSAQEMRIAAHYAEGSLADAFRRDPKTDPHDHVKGIIRELMGLDLPRKHVKITGFQILYGGGPNAISGQLGVEYDEAAKLKKTYFQAMPEMRDLADATSRSGRSGSYIRTWGGRMYYTEPAKVINGRYVDFSYKLLNYLIQGSAADQTKQSVIEWRRECAPETRLLAMVHDEINISAPADMAPQEVAKLRVAMNADRFDVPFLSEGFVGPNWHDITETE